MQENTVFSAKFPKNNTSIFLKKNFSFLNPRKYYSLIPRLSLKPPIKFQAKFKSPETNIPEIVSLKTLSKDLISPYSLRTRDFCKIFSINPKQSFEKFNLPTLPISKLRLKNVKKLEKLKKVKKFYI